MDISSKRRVVEKLIRQSLDKVGIEAQINPYNEYHADEFKFELDIVVDSSKYHKSGPDYVKGYNEIVDYIEDYIDQKLKTFGLDDFYIVPKYKHKNYEWAEEVVLKVLRDLTKNSRVPEEYLKKSFSIGRGRCSGGTILVRPHLNVCIKSPLGKWMTTTNLGRFFSNHPVLEDFFISYST
jgi:hypothetical protein